MFYQNSTISRGLDVDQYNVLLVHDADFAQPYWSAAIESGEDGARDILESIIMDETTNSVLRISPVKGGNENRPKIVIVPRVDLQKIRYLRRPNFGGQHAWTHHGYQRCCHDNPGIQTGWNIQLKTMTASLPR